MTFQKLDPKLGRRHGLVTFKDGNVGSRGRQLRVGVCAIGRGWTEVHKLGQVRELLCGAYARPNIYIYINMLR